MMGLVAVVRMLTLLVVATRQHTGWAFHQSAYRTPRLLALPINNKRALPTLASPHQNRHHGKGSALSLKWLSWPNEKVQNAQQQQQVVEAFFQAYSTGDVEGALNLFAQNCTFENAAYPRTCNGMDELERRLRLEMDARTGNDRLSFVVDDMVVSSTDRKLGVVFHSTTPAGAPIANGRAAALFEFDDDSDDRCLIQNVLWIPESFPKQGEPGLQVLSIASKIIEVSGFNPAATDESKRKTASEIDKDPEPSTRTTRTAPEQYFAGWNRRDMEQAVSVFAEDVTYDDTAFPQPFEGKENMREHMLKCGAAFPPTFTFEVDKLLQNNGGDRIFAQWHVENNGEQLPFTRGCSFYALDSNGKIQRGLDFIEPSGPLKLGGVKLFLDSTRTKVQQEPVRLLAIAVWAAYMWIVFFSDGILPGANALQLEERTWKEVVDLSLNFFLVAPLLGLKFSPSVHPMLEGVFNLLLSWAAMFAGFLSDDRKDKPNLLPMLPTVIGMQFLTSAFLLPYLATRTMERRDNVSLEELSLPAQICESPFLGLSMGIVGSTSIGWFLAGRYSEYGGLSERWSSFLELLSIDRLGSSFLVDLAIFALFQSWFVDDDLKRRGISHSDKRLAWVGKFIPFFGLAYYLFFRPPLRSNGSSDAQR